MNSSYARPQPHRILAARRGPLRAQGPSWTNVIHHGEWVARALTARDDECRSHRSRPLARPSTRETRSTAARRQLLSGLISRRLNTWSARKGVIRVGAARAALVTRLALLRQKGEHLRGLQVVIDGVLVMVVSERLGGPVAAGRSDAELVVAARGDATAFLALYERYFPKVQRYVRIRVAERATCEDITSDVFLRALGGLPEFRRSGSFAAWLFRIAQNAVRSHYRHERSVPLDEAMLVAIPDAALDPPEEAMRRERLQQLRRVLWTLEPEQQNLLALRYGAELNSGEIGEVLGKSAVAVRVALHRTVAELRRRYPDEQR